MRTTDLKTVHLKLPNLRTGKLTATAPLPAPGGALPLVIPPPRAIASTSLSEEKPREEARTRLLIDQLLAPTRGESRVPHSPSASPPRTTKPSLVMIPHLRRSYDTLPTMD